MTDARVQERRDVNLLREKELSERRNGERKRRERNKEKERRRERKKENPHRPIYYSVFFVDFDFLFLRNIFGDNFFFLFFQKRILLQSERS